MRALNSTSLLRMVLVTILVAFWAWVFDIQFNPVTFFISLVGLQIGICMLTSHDQGQKADKEA